MDSMYIMRKYLNLFFTRICPILLRTYRIVMIRILIVIRYLLSPGSPSQLKSKMSVFSDCPHVIGMSSSSRTDFGGELLPPAQMIQSKSAMLSNSSFDTISLCVTGTCRTSSRKVRKRFSNTLMAQVGLKLFGCGRIRESNVCTDDCIDIVYNCIMFRSVKSYNEVND